MKVLKTASQKNVQLDMEMYSPEGLKWIMCNYSCFFYIYNEETNETKYYHYWDEYDHYCGWAWNTEHQVTVRLFITDQVKELKVIYNKEYEFYTTVAIMYDGEEVFVKL